MVEKCLPVSGFRVQVAKLHNGLLAEIKRLQGENEQLRYMEKDVMRQYMDTHTQDGHKAETLKWQQRCESQAKEIEALKAGYHTSTTVEFYVHKFGRAGRLPVIDYLPEERIGHQVEVVIRKAASAKEVV